MIHYDNPIQKLDRHGALDNLVSTYNSAADKLNGLAIRVKDEITGTLTALVGGANSDLAYATINDVPYQAVEYENPRNNILFSKKHRGVTKIEERGGKLYVHYGSNGGNRTATLNPKSVRNSDGYADYVRSKLQGVRDKAKINQIAKRLKQM